jgi:hypothetical protein
VVTDSYAQGLGAGWYFLRLGARQTPRRSCHAMIFPSLRLVDKYRLLLISLGHVALQYTIQLKLNRNASGVTNLASSTVCTPNSEHLENSSTTQERHLPSRALSGQDSPLRRGIVCQDIEPESQRPASEHVFLNLSLLFRDLTAINHFLASMMCYHLYCTAMDLLVNCTTTSIHVAVAIKFRIWDS